VSEPKPDTALRACPEAPPPITVPDVPAPTAVLCCWKQSRAMVRCDRQKDHQGPHSWERAEALDPSLADTQINARIEQILQKILHAEEIEVGDTVFLFDLVRTLRRAEALAPPDDNRADLIQRLRSRAMIEAPPDNEPETRAAFDDVPEITFDELREIAGLLNEAANALESPSPSPPRADARDAR
jgi:hypothetical protein